MIFLGPSNAARYACWNHVKAHPAMRHSWRIAENGTGKATKNQQRHKLPHNVIKIVATKPYDPEGKIEHWSWLINVLRLEMALRVCWVTKCSRWQVGKMDIFCSIFYIKWWNSITSFFNDVQFRYSHVYAVKSEHYTLKSMPILERERELHSSLSKSFKTWYISKKFTDISCMHIYFLYLSLYHANAINLITTVVIQLHLSKSSTSTHPSRWLPGGPATLSCGEYLGGFWCSLCPSCLSRAPPRCSFSAFFFFDFFWGGSLGLLPGNAKKKFSKWNMTWNWSTGWWNSCFFEFPPRKIGEDSYFD